MIEIWINRPKATRFSLFSLRWEWTSIQQARAKTVETNARLEKILDGLSSTDAAIVVFGSLARGEWTHSDVDWTLLIDGQADPEHLRVAQEVGAHLEKGGFTPPGRSGIFGSMTFSHDLVQKSADEKIRTKTQPDGYC